MGILNVTPDSFSDGGLYVNPQSVAEVAGQMIEQGVDLIDVGGESTRPGSRPVSEAEQIRRIEPAIRAVAGLGDIVISIDTTRAAVAKAALQAGADMVNDISGGRDDQALLPLVAGAGVPIALMHMQGTPATMQIDPRYQDVTAEVISFLVERAAAAESAGVARHRILLDPGLGFGKTYEHNLTLLRRLPELAKPGRPLLIGPSRKGFIGKATGVADPMQRQFGTAATIAWAVANGAAVVRVHDVGPIAQVVRMVRAIEGFCD
ncbi:dihydropteroate synthase [Humisphaera borealis]|nr:dihydropteroate synthase [Humisphaera borealis]